MSTENDIPTLLKQIEQILYRGQRGEKNEDKANNIVRYLRFAHEGKLTKVPPQYKEFALMLRHHWRNMQDLSLEEQKKYLLVQIHGLGKHWNT